MSINPGGPQVVARRMETIAADLGLDLAMVMQLAREPATFPPKFNPSHWPPRPTRMCLAVRLGITRILLEARP